MNATTHTSDLTVAALEHCVVVDKNRTHLGHVRRIYLDNGSQQPSWVSVHTGLFGLHETFIPLDEAVLIEKNTLKVPYEQAYVKDAPRIDVERELEPSQEAELYTYYGLEAAAEHAYRQDTAYLGGTTEEFIPGEEPSSTEKYDAVAPRLQRYPGFPAL